MRNAARHALEIAGPGLGRRLGEPPVKDAFADEDEFILRRVKVRRNEGTWRVVILEAKAGIALGVEKMAMAKDVPDGAGLTHAHTPQLPLPAASSFSYAHELRMLLRRRPNRHDLDLTPGQTAQIAGLGAKQRPRDGRGVGDTALAGLRLVLADDREADFLALLVDCDDCRTEADAGGGRERHFEPGGGEACRPVTKLATGATLGLAPRLRRRERALGFGHPVLDLAQAASRHEIEMGTDGAVGQHHGTAARVILLDECSAQDGHSSSVEGRATPLTSPDPGPIRV